MERDQIEDMLQDILQAEPAVADELKSRLFSFEDIPRLPERSRAAVFDQVPTERLILALRDADETLRGAILPVLSSRTRRMVEAELSIGEAPPRRDISRARRDIADLILKLADAGVIELTVGSEALSECI